jgi:hypothetical protein
VVSHPGGTGGRPVGRAVSPVGDRRSHRVVGRDDCRGRVQPGQWPDLPAFATVGSVTPVAYQQGVLTKLAVTVRPDCKTTPLVA